MTFTSIGQLSFCGRCGPIVKGRVCAQCRNPVTGRFVADRGRIFHPDHFKCRTCGKVLKGHSYVMHHDRYYCPLDGQCYLRACAQCKAEFFPGREGDKVKWHHKLYHSRCFCCRVCCEKCDPQTAKAVHGRPHCDQCYSQRVEERDVNEAGKSMTKHKHNTTGAFERRNRFGEIFGREIQGPKLAMELFEEEEDSSEELARSSSRHGGSSRHGSSRRGGSTHGSEHGESGHGDSGHGSDGGSGHGESGHGSDTKRKDRRRGTLRRSFRRSRALSMGAGATVQDEGPQPHHRHRSKHHNDGMVVRRYHHHAKHHQEAAVPQAGIIAAQLEDTAAIELVKERRKSLRKSKRASKGGGGLSPSALEAMARGEEPLYED
jgi:hypothetical protein